MFPKIAKFGVLRPCSRKVAPCSTTPQRSGGRERRNPTAVRREYRRIFGGWESIFSFEHLFYGNTTMPSQTCQPLLGTNFLFTALERPGDEMVVDKGSW